MSKAEDIATGVALIGALKGLGGGNTAPPAPNPAPRPDADPGTVESDGPDNFTRADIDALIGCLDSIADSLEAVSDAVKIVMLQAAAAKADAPAPATNHGRKPR